MVVKFSRSLFLFYYIALKMIISLCCIMLHMEFPKRISLCFYCIILKMFMSLCCTLLHRELLERISLCFYCTKECKRFRYFLKYSCVARKKWKSEKLETTLEVLNEVCVEFPETKQFMEEHLEQVCYKENISVEEVIYFLFTSLEAKG